MQLQQASLAAFFQSPKSLVKYKNRFLKKMFIRLNASKKVTLFVSSCLHFISRFWLSKVTLTKFFQVEFQKNQRHDWKNRNKNWFTGSVLAWSKCPVLLIFFNLDLNPTQKTIKQSEREMLRRTKTDCTKSSPKNPINFKCYETCKKIQQNWKLGHF